MALVHESMTDAKGEVKLERIFADKVEIYARLRNSEGGASVEVKPGTALAAEVELR